MTNKEPKAQAADLTAQCSYYKGNKRLQKGQAARMASGWVLPESSPQLAA